MGKAITMKDLEAINFPYYYNLVKEGKMKAGEVKELLFNGNHNKYRRYKSVMEGKPTYTEAERRRNKKYQKTDKYIEYEKKRRKTDKWKEYHKEHHKKYYEANREAILNYHKKYQQTQDGKVFQKEASKRYYQTSKGKETLARANHKRRALKKGNGGNYTADEWNKCLDYFNHCDAYTGEPLTTTEVEHVIPVSKGGINNIYNIVPANGPTNRSKHNSGVFEWYSQQPYFSWDRYLKICLWIIKMGGAIEE